MKTFGSSAAIGIASGSSVIFRVTESLLTSLTGSSIWQKGSILRTATAAMRPGCICCSRRGGIEVGAIDEKGPAYTAGVRKKDVLVALCVANRRLP